MTSRRAGIVAVVFAGGSVGGLVRYATVQAWPSPALAFPWATLTVNLAGALVLGALVVAVAELDGPRYVRPLVGTGFCGALTTFSSVVVAVDRMAAHDHAATAASYLGASVVGGLAAAALGVIATRGYLERRRRRREVSG